MPSLERPDPTPQARSKAGWAEWVESRPAQRSSTSEHCPERKDDAHHNPRPPALLGRRSGREVRRGGDEGSRNAGEDIDVRSRMGTGSNVLLVEGSENGALCLVELVRKSSSQGVLTHPSECSSSCG
jgi:hypothetical protein